MKKIILLGVFIVGLVLAAIISMLFSNWENSVNRLLKNIGEVDELKVFPLPNDGENPLFSTRDTQVIQGFLDTIEFERVSPGLVVCLKMPGALEFVTTGVATQRFQLVGWEYLRTDNGLLRGDVELTEASSQNMADWLINQKIMVSGKKKGQPVKYSVSDEDKD